MSRNLLRLLDLHADDDPLLFPSSSCPFLASPSSSLLSATHHPLLFPSSPSCPLGFTTSLSPYDTFDLDLDLFLPPHPPTISPALDETLLLHALGHRVSALELALSPPAPAPRRKYTYAAEAGDRKVKWTAEEKPAGERTLKWEAELKTPHDGGFDRKWKWESKGSSAGARKVKWAKEVKGKGWLEPWSHAYSVEEAFDSGEDQHGNDNKTEKKNKKVKEEKKEIKETNKKCAVKIVQIEDNTAGCVAIRKGPDYMVRNAKRSMLEELEGMLEIVEPQLPGKPRTPSRRKFYLPEAHP